MRKLPGEHYSEQINARFWLLGKPGEAQTYVGIGRIELLEKIGQYGSMNRAAKEMGMSYKKAWKLIEELNTFSDQPLVIKTHGGVSGGGTQLTQQGQKVIAQFRAFEKRFQTFLQQESQQMQSILNASESPSDDA
ncbi:winged helix-turn-helix domain-containing protein [Galenea microaerophila]